MKSFDARTLVKSGCVCVCCVCSSDFGGRIVLPKKKKNKIGKFSQQFFLCCQLIFFKKFRFKNSVCKLQLMETLYTAWDISKPTKGRELCKTTNRWKINCFYLRKGAEGMLTFFLFDSSNMTSLSIICGRQWISFEAALFSFFFRTELKMSSSGEMNLGACHSGIIGCSAELAWIR